MNKIDELKIYTKKVYLKKLTLKEKLAIQHYTNTSYFINKSLRNDENNYIKYINNIDSAIDKFDNKFNIRLYRGLIISDSKELKKIINSFEKTKEIIDKAYMSCSINLKSIEFNYNILLDIDFPINANGAYIGNLSLFDEEEFLIARNQKLKILDINENNNIYYVKTKLI